MTYLRCGIPAPLPLSAEHRPRASTLSRTPLSGRPLRVSSPEQWPSAATLRGSPGSSPLPHGASCCYPSRLLINSAENRIEDNVWSSWGNEEGICDYLLARMRLTGPKNGAFGLFTSSGWKKDPIVIIPAGIWSMMCRKWVTFCLISGPWSIGINRGVPPKRKLKKLVRARLN